MQRLDNGRTERSNAIWIVRKNEEEVEDLKNVVYYSIRLLHGSAIFDF